MILFPAVDLMGGEAVRLLKGEYEKKTVYSKDPLAVALDFARAGAEWIHVVDLEGARDGDTPNFDSVARIIKDSGLKVEIGGGVRNRAVIEKYLEAGAARVILGTAAVKDPAFLEESARAYGERLAVGVDMKDGYVAVSGWTEVSALRGEDFIARLQDLGVSTAIVTDISRDGAMQGTNRGLYRTLREKFSVNITASGGVSSMEDVLALRDMDLYGAIIGKAYYTGAIDLGECVRACR